FFLAMAVNPEGDVPPMLTDASGEPIVTFMDFGREIFGNLVDVAIYGSGNVPTGPIPDIAAVLRVNDVERSKALWGFGLGLAGMAGGSGGPQQIRIAGHTVDVYDAGGVPLHLAADGNRLIVSPSRSAMEQALETTKRGGRSVMDDPAFAGSLKGFENKATLVLAANVGRCMALAGATSSPKEAMIADLLAETVVAARIEHTDTRLAFRARVSHIPDVSGLVAQALGSGGPPRGLLPDRNGGGRGGSGHGNGREALRATFDELSGAPATQEAALAVGRKLLASEDDDPLYLNNFAWALITEDQYGGNYLDLARSLAEQANEASDHRNWYYLDTLALVEFQSGNLERAVKLERRAVELAADDPRGSDAEKQLAVFEAALSEAAVVFE
ncbi:MAG: hypothetical protein O7B99_09690, partial [Planctomycetota bacterium]|nr:hypothetical protein [Planctomycetota bacterium]